MKKFIFLSLISLFFIVFAKSATPTFACEGCHDIPETKISGKVKDQDHKKVVGAQVTTVCTHDSQNYNKTTTTNGQGKYEVIYPSNQCDDGDSVTVTATKDGATGTDTGIVRERRCLRDIAIINIILVPEFGLITGAFAALTSAGAFWVMKKKNSINK
jgi:ribosomal protein S17